MRRIALVIACAVALTTAALADFQVNLGPPSSSFSGVAGGSFGVQLHGTTVPPGLRFGPSVGQTWGLPPFSDVAGRTFCVEGVGFDAPGTWYEASVDAEVFVGSPGQLKALTTGTRIAFAHYVFGTLPASIGNPGIDFQRNNAMQAYFWDQQQVEAHGLWVPNYWFNQLNMVERGMYNDLAALTPTGYEASVMVLNLWLDALTDDIIDKQSQLVMVSAIPAPAAVVLGFVGIGMARWMRRRLN